MPLYTYPSQEELEAFLLTIFEDPEWQEYSPEADIKAYEDLFESLEV